MAERRSEGQRIGLGARDKASPPSGALIVVPQRSGGPIRRNYDDGAASRPLGHQTNPVDDLLTRILYNCEVVPAHLRRRGTTTASSSLLPKTHGPVRRSYTCTAEAGSAVSGRSFRFCSCPS